MIAQWNWGGATFVNMIPSKNSSFKNTKQRYLPIFFTVWNDKINLEYK